MPFPKESQTQVRQFLGACSFYRRWIGSYAKLALPLNSLLKDGVDVPTIWDKDPKTYEDATLRLKEALTSYPILRQPDFHKQFVLYTDASDYAIGGVIGQMHEGKMCAVAYTSRALQGPEKNYSVQEKEALGIVHAIKKFRHYLLCANVTIRTRIMTDHRSLQHLQTQKGLAGRMARWAMIMSEYFYEIQYIKGSLNDAADTLSRLLTIPEADWQALPSTDRDGDDHHPFLMLWPTENLLVLALHANTESAAYDKILTDDPWIAKEEYLNSIESEITPHERVLFSRETTRISGTSRTIKISPDDYRQCDEFKDIYTYLESIDDDERKAIRQANERHRSLAYQRQKPAKSIEKRRGIEKHNQPHVTHKGNKKQQKPSVDVTCFYIDPTNSLLYRIAADSSEALCVPNVTHDDDTANVRYRIFEELHNTPLTGHRGLHATYRAMRSRFYWSKMLDSGKKPSPTSINTFIKACDHCQNNKIDRKRSSGLIQPLQQPTGPGQSMSIDFLTDLPPSTIHGYHTLWVIVDRFSARKYAIPTWKNADAETSVELWIDWMCTSLNGVPQSLVSDRDRIFTSKFWELFQKRIGTQVRLSSSRSQQTNGLAERSIAVIEEMLRNVVSPDQSNWVSTIPSLLFALNTSLLDKLGGRSPAEVERGQQPALPIDLVSSLGLKEPNEPVPAELTNRLKMIKSVHKDIMDRAQDANERMTKYANERKRDGDAIQIGTYVRLSLDGIDLSIFKHKRSRKLSPLWHGPYKVISQVSPVSFKIELPANTKLHNVFHISRLKPAADFSLDTAKNVHLPAHDYGDKQFEVAGILAHKWLRGKIQYLVHWKGYSRIYDATWEPRNELLVNAKSIIDRYEHKFDIDVNAPKKGEVSDSRPKRSKH